MLSGQSIICFAHDWQGDPTSKTHIMRILARRNQVIWVNSIGMRRPRASASDLNRIVRKLRRGLTGAGEVEPGLQVVDPLVIPLPGIKLADGLNAMILSARLRRLCRRRGMRRPILWTFLPNVTQLLGRLDERLVIYHCVDEYSAFSGVPRQALAAMERELVRRADLVLTSAERLCDERRPLNPATYFVPHGVDVEHFSTARDPATVVPEDIAVLPGPVIGFFGLIADWVDLDLIANLARARPAWSFVLIGARTTPVDALRGLPNVHLLGRRPYGELPGYCRRFDAGILPFRRNELTLRANPLKLREYLAAGLPVVATPLPEVERYRRLVHLADGVPGFLAGLERALREGNEAHVHRRLQAMREEDWTARVEIISNLVETGVAA